MEECRLRIERLLSESSEVLVDICACLELTAAQNLVWIPTRFLYQCLLSFALCDFVCRHMAFSFVHHDLRLTAHSGMEWRRWLADLRPQTGALSFVYAC